MIEKTSSAKNLAAPDSSAPEYFATAPYHWPGSSLSGAPSAFWYSASSAAPPRMLAAASERSRSRLSPVSCAARSMVRSEAGSSAGAGRASGAGSGRPSSPRASSSPAS
ncbi:hypothetical protein [Nonomuraea salmonea]|uniref:hypothetical protein n=1 Tax=Nonomuraea salmonea TaxID=46181 RepID=UPI002FEDA6A6